jgi:toxin YoeB
MRLLFSEQGWEDYLWWQAHDRKVLERINVLIKETSRNPFQGIGKPEPLRGDLSGWWSRRITQEHRLVYRAVDGTLQIAQCRYHY